MTTMNWKQFFQSHPTFSPLANANFLRRLDNDTESSECAEKTYDPGEMIIEQGKPAEALYFVGEGRVNVSVLGPDREEIEIGTIGEGNFFGELALLGEGDRPRSASVKACSKCILLRVKASEFRKAVHQHPDVASEMLLILSDRLRQLAERLAEVAYQDVNNKIQLIGAKLDAELKAMNASLIASQTVFEQTTARAHEVVESGEKFWKRVTWVGTVFIGGFSVILTFIGFLGFHTFDDIRDRAEDATGEIEAVAEEAKDAKTAYKEIEGLRDTLLGGASLVILPELFERIVFSRLGSNSPVNYRVSSAEKIFGFVLRSNDMALSTEIFTYLQGKLVQTLKTVTEKTDTGERTFEHLRKILEIGIENKDDKKISPRDVAISYYLTLISLAHEQNSKLFNSRLDEFKYYRRKQYFEFSDNDRSQFEPTLFRYAVENNESIDDDRKPDILKKIDSAWATLLWS